MKLLINIVSGLSLLGGGIHSDLWILDQTTDLCGYEEHQLPHDFSNISAIMTAITLILFMPEK